MKCLEVKDSSSGDRTSDPLVSGRATAAVFYFTCSGIFSTCTCIIVDVDKVWLFVEILRVELIKQFPL